MKVSDLARELEKIIGIEPSIDDDIIVFSVDRGPRIDHGGGEDGDEWLDDYQQAELSDKFKEKHLDKINRISRFLEENEVGGSVYWEYQEKGDCQIVIYS